MAENSDEGDWQSYGNWFGGWIRTVKDTSVSALEVVKTQTASAVELVKRDMGEFSQTMQCDTSTAAARIKDNIRTEDEEATHGGRIKAGIGSLLGGISKMLMVEPDSDDESEEVLISKSGPVFDSAKARLQALQLDADTYCTEVEDLEDFHRWLDDFVVDDHKGEISELLVTNSEIRSIYTQAVPTDLSHSLFWQRYFYRVHCLARNEMRRSQLKQRARTIETSMHEDLDMGDDWVDFDSPSSPIRSSFLDRRMRQTDQSLQEPEVITMSHDVPALSPPLLRNETETHPSSPSIEPLTSIIYSTVPESDEQLSKIVPNSDDEESIVNISERSSPERVRENQSLGVADVILAETDDASDDLSVSRDVVQPDDRILSISVEEALKIETDKVTDDSKLGHNVTSDDGTHVTEVELKTREKGDMVLVGGRSGNTPTDSTGSNKDSVASLETEDWDDFDVELTEDDLKFAEEVVKLRPDDPAEENGDEWENWE